MGALIQRVDRATLRDVYANQTGSYGIVILASQQVTLEGSAATGARAAGLAVSQSAGVTVRGSEAFGNTVGLEVINSAEVVLEQDHSHENGLGVLVATLPGMETKQGGRVRVADNRLLGNTLTGLAEEGSFHALLPAGTGVLLLGADGVEVSGNEITGNSSAGVALLSLRRLLPDQTSFDVGTEPEHNWIHGNSYQDNGGDPAEALLQADLGGADLVWDTSGADNQWSERGASSHPAPLPGPQFPEFVRRGLWRVLSISRQLQQAR
jgi:parallel beta-helix repeat protein